MKPNDDFRVWNAQLIRYAGYKQNDGSILGDPANVEFTEVRREGGRERGRGREKKREKEKEKERERERIIIFCHRFIQICKRLGWKSPKEQTAFDVLPLVLQAHGGEAQCFNIPPEIILETAITHPE